MKTQYILPAGCALAFHAILLLGFNGRPPTPAVMIKNTPQVLPDPHHVVEVEDIILPPVADDEADPMPKPQRGDPHAGNPGLPEPPVTTGPRDFGMAPTPAPVRISDSDKINPGILGVPDGLPNGIPGVDTVVDFTKLDKRPQARVQVAPIYPTEAKMRGIEGQVLVGFTVDVAGRVMAPYVIECSDHAFAQPALLAVSKWRFMPGLINGRAVRFRMAVPIVFRLNE